MTTARTATTARGLAATLLAATGAGALLCVAAPVEAATAAPAVSSVAAVPAATSLPAPKPARRLPGRTVAAAETGPVATRVIDRSVLNQPCGTKKYVDFANGPVLVADLGGGARMGDVDIVRTARAAGFSWDEMPTALAVLGAESDRCPSAIHNNLSATGQVLSTDRGLYQINDRWHPEYAPADMFDPLKNMKAAKAIKDRAGWTAWHGYDNRAIYAGWADWAIIEAKNAGVR